MGALPAEASVPAEMLLQQDEAAQASALQTDAVQSEDADESPRACIDPLMASHIAATLLSLAPIPGFADAADAAAYALNLALKNCPPELIPPDPIVIETPNAACVHHMVVPLPAGWSELVSMDKAIIQELLADPELNLTQSERAELQKQLQSEYGRFDNIAYGSYSNIYGLTLPIQVTAYASPFWGDVGSPEVFHYNSDAMIELTLPGKRISEYLMEVPVGNYELQWKADTMISAFDYIPFFLASSLYRYSKVARAQAQKRFAIDGTKAALKKQIEQVLKEGNRYFAKQVAKEIAKNILKKGIIAGGKVAYKTSPYFTAGDYSGATTVAYQRLTIVDSHPPQINGVHAITVEALDPGGLQSGRKINELMAAITVTDDCDADPTLTYATPRFWPLLVDNNGSPLPSAEITWRASDNGAASKDGGVNTTEVKQQVTVVDTLPPILVAPPPVMMYAAAGDNVQVPLGAPQVFDVADLRPTVTYNQTQAVQGAASWPLFSQGVHYVTWTATDRSGNTSDPQQQLVNIKAPGTNNVPTANPLMGGNTVQAIADEPVKITVTGNDPDVDGSSMRDPIWFRVDRAPGNGFFIAPLYPYFIDDYRITARYSPWIAQREGEAKAWEVAQDPNAMRDYIKALCAEDMNRTDLPKDFVSFLGGDQKYMAVDDDGFTYIYDQAYRKCSPGGSTIDPTTSPRISVWDQQGKYLGEQERNDGGRPLRNIKFNVGRGTILTTSSDGSSTGDSLINISTIQPQNSGEPIVNVRSYGLWNKVNSIYIASEDVNRTPEYKNAGAAAFDNTTGVLYVIGDRNQNLKGMSAFVPAPCNQGGGDGPEDCLEYVGSQVFSYAITQSTKWGDFPGLDGDVMKLERLGDITLDSRGNVYVLANVASGYRFDRIYKFAPAVKHLDGMIELGELIGWMGKCDSGLNCNYIEQHSIGFACTDATCAFEGDSFGSRPGQFQSVGAIAMDPNDVLYVADTGNQRVQRFTPEGSFAGEARSQSSCAGCSGFVLGDFGSPGNIAVNSNNFYILDKSTELVHVFETSVIHSIDDKSAWVEYQSKPNYVGSDSFTFRATDGFHDSGGELIESTPAQVDINVSRNFRPPIAEDGWATTAEDTPIGLVLKGYDLDGSLDTLTYKISFQPQYGKLSGNPPNVTYTPGKDYSGKDSFTFTVSDGKFMSEPATFTVEVVPVSDTPVVVPKSNSLQAGLGYPVTLRAVVLDADEGDELTAVVDWGDNTKESSGDLNQTGGTQGPSLTPLVEGRGAELLAYHTYNSAGVYTIVIEVTDAAGNKGSAQVSVTVQAMADLVLQRNSQPLVPVNQKELLYELTVRNQRSSAGDGVTAKNVSVSEIITGSAAFVSASASSGDCQIDGKLVTCNLGDLGSDAEAKVSIKLSVGGGVMKGAVISLDASATSNTPDPIVENNRDRFDLSVVAAGNYYVNSLRDGPDATPGDGTCATTEGYCTARAAIMEANAQAGAQIVVFGNGVYVLENLVTAAAVDEDSASGDLDVDGDLTLLGNGAQNTTLNGNAIDRVLDIHGGVVQIEGMTIAGGNADDGADGGGIRNDGADVRLRRVSVDGNSAQNGGGILNASGKLSLMESSVVQNTAQGSGGGILNQVELTLENVTISGNHADVGGGIAGAGGNAQLRYVTIAGNSAANTGGGVNSAGSAVRIENSLLAGNDAPGGPDCAPTVTSDGHNVIGTRQGCNVTGSSNGNVTDMAPMIDSLTLNAAQTYSHPLLAGSPALGLATCLVQVDQGGAERPEQGCDAGAYEAGSFVGADRVLLPIVHRQ